MLIERLRARPRYASARAFRFSSLDLGLNAEARRYARYDPGRPTRPR
jgi:hypothetical protein